MAVASAMLLSGALVISANAATLSVTTTSLHDGAVGQPYDSATATLAATGGTSPYLWSVQSGSLPAGLALSSAGAISGTPSALGNTTFTVKVTDNSSNTATRELTIKVNPAVVVQTGALPPAPVNSAYPATQLVSTGGTGAYTWTVSAGTLAPLTLSAAGIISGITPAVATTLNFTVRATDGAGHSDQQSLAIVVSPAGALTVTTASLPSGVRGTAYPTQSLTAVGGVAPYTWALEAGSSLPAGLALSAAGAITGTPTTTGSTTFTVRVTDTSASTLTATRQFTVAVMAPLDITTATTLPAASLGASYATVLRASGGTPPYLWASTPPVGLGMSATTGAITGTPAAAGTTSFSVQVTDFHGYQLSETFLLTVNAAAALTITTTTPSLPNALVNADYTQQLTKTGGSGTIAWSISAGALPTGLVLGSSGLITGIPTLLGSSTFTVRAVGSVSGDDTEQLSINVTSVPQQPTTGGGNTVTIKDEDQFRGLCNAFFEGSENGRQQKARATAFQRLISAAGADGEWQTVQDKVRSYCSANSSFRSLCNAFFEGSESGRQHKAKTTAFQPLISAAGADGEWQALQAKVRAYCGTNNPNSNILASFRDNGDDDDDDDDDDDKHRLKSSSQGQQMALENLSKNKGKSNGKGRDD